jgi:very-short-patch-repair endonuclease
MRKKKINKPKEKKVILHPKQPIKLWDYDDFSVGTRAKMGKSHKGKHYQSEEYKRKLIERMSGSKNPNFGKCGNLSPKFGKPNSEETRRKISETAIKNGSHKGERNSQWGILRPQETRIKISKALKGKYLGEKCYWFGKSLSELTKNKISQSHKGKKLTEEHKHKIGQASKLLWKNPHYRKKMCEMSKSLWQKPNFIKNKSKKMKLHWQNQTYKEKVIRSIMVGNNIIPNKPEQKLISFFKKNNLPYKFVGDGKLIISGKCPDFVNCNGQKKIIELFGDYWHSKQITGNKKNQEEFQRKALFKEFGFTTLIIWEHELRDITTLKSKIVAFERFK